MSVRDRQQTAVAAEVSNRSCGWRRREGERGVRASGRDWIGLRLLAEEREREREAGKEKKVLMTAAHGGTHFRPPPTSRVWHQKHGMYHLFTPVTLRTHTHTHTSAHAHKRTHKRTHMYHVYLTVGVLRRRRPQVPCLSPQCASRPSAAFRLQEHLRLRHT